MPTNDGGYELNTNMSPNEKKVLIALAEIHSECGGYCSFDYIATLSGLPRDKIRRTVRSLARQGFAEFGKGLWTEDGEPAGSGYKCSDDGLHLYWNEIVAPAKASVSIGIREK
jgi:hypothetical protein